MNKTPDTIRCGDHGSAPYHIICVHLIDGRPADEWLKIDLAEDDTREVDADWICMDCGVFTDAHGGELGVLEKHDRVRLICMHCVNRLKLDAGFVPDDAGILIQPPISPPEEGV